MDGASETDFCSYWYELQFETEVEMQIQILLWNNTYSVMVIEAKKSSFTWMEVLYFIVQ